MSVGTVGPKLPAEWSAGLGFKSPTCFSTAPGPGQRPNPPCTRGSSSHAGQSQEKEEGIQGGGCPCPGQTTQAQGEESLLGGSGPSGRRTDHARMPCDL